MDAGISQENNAAQDITLEINPGEVFVVPQGLLHYNHNRQCVPNVFFQSFTSSDPGALNVVGALAAFAGAGDAGSAAAKASTTDGIIPSPQGAFALDQQCLRECGFPQTGAPNGGLDGLPHEIKALFSL
jgi:Cupin